MDLEKIECSFKNGLLTVTLPKSAQAQKSCEEDRGETGLGRSSIISSDHSNFFVVRSIAGPVPPPLILILPPIMEDSFIWS